jgi:hypothetical protein
VHTLARDGREIDRKEQDCDHHDHQRDFEFDHFQTPVPIDDISRDNGGLY